MPILYKGNLPWNSACQRACSSGWSAATAWPRRYYLINQSQTITKTDLLEHASFHASPCLWQEATSSHHQKSIPSRRRLMTKAAEVRENRERNAVDHCYISPSRMCSKETTTNRRLVLNASMCQTASAHWWYASNEMPRHVSACSSIAKASEYNPFLARFERK